MSKWGGGGGGQFNRGDDIELDVTKSISFAKGYTPTSTSSSITSVQTNTKRVACNETHWATTRKLHISEVDVLSVCVHVYLL